MKSLAKKLCRHVLFLSFTHFHEEDAYLEKDVGGKGQKHHVVDIGGRRDDGRTDGYEEDSKPACLDERPGMENACLSEKKKDDRDFECDAESEDHGRTEGNEPVNRYERSDGIRPKTEQECYTRRENDETTEDAAEIEKDNGKKNECQACPAAHGENRLKLIPDEEKEDWDDSEDPGVESQFNRREESFREVEIVYLDVRRSQKEVENLFCKGEVDRCRHEYGNQTFPKESPAPDERYPDRFSFHCAEVLAVPMDMMYFRASSTPMSRKESSLSGTMMRYPDVGFGAVGTKTEHMAGRLET